jgi:hypothetical protein
MAYSVPSAARQTEQLKRGGRLTIRTLGTSFRSCQTFNCVDGDLPFPYVIGEAEAFRRDASPQAGVSL